MATTGRNRPCPCGSGKKYKLCCLPADEQRQAALRAATPASSPAASVPRSASSAPRPTAVPTSPAVRPGCFLLEDDGLDDLSNSVLDLVRTGRFDEALAACDRLLELFPDVVDGFERSGMVHAKMGNHTLAADFYRKALDFVTHPSRRDDYEDVDFYRKQVEREERLAGLR
jgi:tetratricopeptide (TPR) repeat protein